MKLFPAKCHERATLRKAMTSNGKQFTVTRSTVHCWPLLHMMAGISARFSNFAFVLFCHITNHLMTGPLGNSEFCSLEISMFPSTSSRETLRFSGNKIHWSSRDLSLSVKYYPHNMLSFRVTHQNISAVSQLHVAVGWRFKCTFTNLMTLKRKPFASVCS